MKKANPRLRERLEEFGGIQATIDEIRGEGCIIPDDGEPYEYSRSNQNDAEALARVILEVFEDCLNERPDWVDSRLSMADVKSLLSLNGIKLAQIEKAHSSPGIKTYMIRLAAV